MKDMGWFVIQTERGFWIECAEKELDNAVRGPFESRAEALDAMYREEQRPERVLLFAYVAICLGVVAGFVWRAFN